LEGDRIVGEREVGVRVVGRFGVEDSGFVLCGCGVWDSGSRVEGCGLRVEG
jgi:hypothetical protein